MMNGLMKYTLKKLKHGKRDIEERWKNGRDDCIY